MSKVTWDGQALSLPLLLWGLRLEVNVGHSPVGRRKNRMMTAKLSESLRLYATGLAVILSLMRFAYLTLRRVSPVALVASLIFAATISAQQPHTLTGDIRFHKSFHSKILSNDRDVVVYLPPGYESNKKRYSVLYLHDGQNLFDGATPMRGF